MERNLEIYMKYYKKNKNIEVTNMSKETKSIHRAIIIVNDERIDVSHLQPFTFSFDCVSLNKKNLLRVKIVFSSHCISKKYDASTHPPNDTIIDIDTSNKRTFCPVRHQCSLDLPEVIQHLQKNPEIHIHKTHHNRNWNYSITLPTYNDPYIVFFTLEAQKNKTREDLFLFIESAYPNTTPGYPEQAGSRMFSLVCADVYKNLDPFTNGKKSKRR